MGRKNTGGDTEQVHGAVHLLVDPRCSDSSTSPTRSRTISSSPGNGSGGCSARSSCRLPDRRNRLRVSWAKISRCGARKRRKPAARRRRANSRPWSGMKPVIVVQGIFLDHRVARTDSSIRPSPYRLGDAARNSTTSAPSRGALALFQKASISSSMARSGRWRREIDPGAHRRRCAGRYHVLGLGARIEIDSAQEHQQGSAPAGSAGAAGSFSSSSRSQAEGAEPAVTRAASHGSADDRDPSAATGFPGLPGASTSSCSRTPGCGHPLVRPGRSRAPGPTR